MIAKKRVVILAPPCGDIEQSVARAFRSSGWVADVLTYGNVYPKHLLERAVFSISPEVRQTAIRKDFNATVRTRLLPAVAQEKPGFVLVLKGHRLDADNRRALQNLGMPLVVWAYDSLARCPEMNDVIDLAAHTFYIDGGDVPEGAENASWLPLGFDESIFSPALGSSPEIDVLFIGSLGKLYTRRRYFLKMLAESGLAREFRIAFIGSTGKRINDMRLHLNPAVDWIGKRLSVEELARCISRAKICINIHQDDGVKPVNPLFFAIPGSGSCQLVENKHYFGDWLRPGVDYVDFADDDFLPGLTSLLTDDSMRSTIAAAGLDRAIAEHTYKQRVRQICMQLQGAE